MTAFYLFF